MSAQLPEMRPVKGFEGIYSVTRDGRIFRHARAWVTGRKGCIRREVKSGWAALNVARRYITLTASKDGRKSCVLVHRAVAEAWIPNPGGLPQVNHKNGDRHDNRAQNLEWVTAAGNTRHFHQSGRWSPTPAFVASVRRNAATARAAKARKQSEATR